MVGWAWLGLTACTVPAPEVQVQAPVPPEPPLDGAVRVVVRVPAAEAARVDVELTAIGGPDEATFRMPVWTPGSYLVREYARQVERLEAVGPDGAPLAVRKSAKNRWTVEPAAAITLRYSVYAHELSVRTALVEPDLGVLVGAALFMEPTHLPGAAYDVTIEAPPSWPVVVSALPPHPSGEPNRWLARSWDELIDSPWLAGRVDLRTFDLRGAPFTVAVVGGEGWWDLAATAEEVQKIAETQVALWGVVPFDHYALLAAVAEGGGGLEHANSALVLGRRAQGRDPVAHRRWLSTVSHELFHAWNVKRLRPAALGPFDYEREVYTPSLWVAEGWTAYYDDLLLVRAGLMEPAELLERLSAAVAALQKGYGRRVQPLSEAGFDAWIKHYRPDDNSPNRDVDYYTKGALVAWLLDARIRERSDDVLSLDDVLRHAWERFPPDRGYREEELRALISEVAGMDLGPWLAEVVDGTSELDWAPALTWWGLRFAPPAAADVPAVWIGLEDGAVVATVPRGSPAEAAGVMPGDELIAVDDARVAGGALAAALLGRQAGETVTLLVARRGRLQPLDVALVDRPADTWRLEFDPTAGPGTTRRRDAWLAAHGEVRRR